MKVNKRLFTFIIFYFFHKKQGSFCFPADFYLPALLLCLLHIIRCALRVMRYELCASPKFIQHRG